MAEAKRDQNSVTTLLAVSSADGITPVVLWADPTTHRLLVDLATGAGDVFGPASSTDNAIVRFDGTGGKTLQNSAVTIADTTGAMAWDSGQNATLIAAASRSMILQSGGVTALTLDSSQDALFAPTNRIRITGTKVLSFGATANATIGVSADTTAGILTFTAPSAGSFSFAGGNVALGANSLTLTGSIGATGARVTKLWATDIESTNMPTVGGVAILTSLTNPQFTTIELGNASDTTLARVSAGVISVEGVEIATISATQTFTNKIMTSTTNNVAAKSLHSASTVIDVVSATAPSAGQVLTATGASAATWQTPATTTPYPLFYNNGKWNNDSSRNYGMFSDSALAYFNYINTTTFFLVDLGTTNCNENRVVTTDWADADQIQTAVILGLYVYVLLKDTGGPAFRVYRYLKTDLAAGGTLMTISGTALGAQNVDMIMSCDGTNFYFNWDGANDGTNTHEIAKYSLSGTTLTYVSTTTCGATAANFIRFHVRASDGSFIGVSNADAKMRRYNTSGTLQWTAPNGIGDYQYFTSLAGEAFYQGSSDASLTGVSLMRQAVE